MGGDKQIMIVSLIQLQFGDARDGPFGPIVGVTLLVFVVIILIISAQLAARKGVTA